MNSALSARAPLPVVAVAFVFLSVPPLATAQNNLGEALDLGANKVSAEEFRRDVVQRAIVGLTPTGGTFEIVFMSNGAISGTGTASRSSPVQTGISGEWRIDDRDRICTTMRAITGQLGGGAGQSPSLNLPTRCQFWFKVGEHYFLSDSDSDRQERVFARTVKVTTSYAPLSGVQSLPKSMRGKASIFQGGASNPWTLSVTKTNEDGTFDGLVSYNGQIAADVAGGRRCIANDAALTNGIVKDGEVRFNVAMGPQCAGTFILRKGIAHFLEGQLTVNFNAAAAPVWLDPDQ